MTPEPQDEPKKIKLVCLDCGKETMVDVTDWDNGSTERIISAYHQCDVCMLKFKGGPVTINDQ